MPTADYGKRCTVTPFRLVAVLPYIHRAVPAPTIHVPNSTIAALRNVAQKALQADLSGLVVATFAVQGLSYALQLALAAVLAPRDFGIVRVTEVVVASATIFAAAGMPSMMMRFVAEQPLTGWRRLVTHRVLATVARSAAVVAVAVALISRALVTADAAAFLVGLAPCVAFAAVSRTCIAYFYGVSDARRVPRLTVPPAVLATVVVITGARFFGLWGWVAGRVVGDLLLVLIAATAVRATLGDGEPAAMDERLRARLLLATGVPLAVSLLARSLIDSSPVLVLARAAGASDALGVVGLVSLIAAALTVVPGSMATLALPSMVRLAQQDRLELSRKLCRLVGVTLALTLPAAVLGALVAEPLTRRLLPAYAPGMSTAAWLLLTVPPRVLASLAGTSMLATDRVQSAFVLTLGTLAVILAAQALAAGRWGLEGVVAATLAIESLSALVFLLMARRHIRHPALTSQSPAPR